jgi:hypothetical protein
MIYWIAGNCTFMQATFVILVCYTYKLEMISSFYCHSTMIVLSSHIVFNSIFRKITTTEHSETIDITIIFYYVHIKNKKYFMQDGGRDHMIFGFTTTCAICSY